MNKNKTILFSSVFALLSICLGIFEYLNFTTYCYSQGRYLGDLGIIKAAVLNEINNPNIMYKKKGDISYNSIEQFNEINPICCRIQKFGDQYFAIWNRRRAVWIRRLIGKYFIIVDMAYRFKNEGKNQFWSAHYLVDACGVVRERGGGEVSSGIASSVGVSAK